MSHYTNPAFCQKSEFYPNADPSTETEQSNRLRNEFKRSTSRSTWTAHSLQQMRQKVHQPQLHQRVLPPKPGQLPPKPFQFNIKSRFGSQELLDDGLKSQLNTSGYALVPLDELPSRSKDRYAILPATEAHLLHNSTLRLSKSQDRLDYDVSEFGCDGDEAEDSFTSLPVFTTQEDNRKIKPAFSSDFINKSMVLVDQNSMQRYTVVPTDDDEEVVDSNHEIIEMCNGRAHRYTIIPTDDDDNNYMQNEYESRPKQSNNNKNQVLNDSNIIQKQIIKHETPPKTKPLLINLQRCNSSPANRHLQPRTPIRTQASLHYEEQSKELPVTPTKNQIATQKLHELLSTPRKCEQDRILQRHGSYQTIIQRSPNQIQLQQFNSTIQKRTDFTPQKLHYEAKTSQTTEHRTTAIISPRLHQQMAFNDTTLCSEKTWPHESLQKVENATATIAVISLMLILSGILNSGLCLYMVHDVSILDQMIIQSILFKDKTLTQNLVGQKFICQIHQIFSHLVDSHKQNFENFIAFDSGFLPIRPKIGVKVPRFVHELLFHFLSHFSIHR